MALAIPKGSLVLVTGATGYIGSWVTHEFVKQGYIVRAAVRSQEKADILKKAIEKEFGADKLEFAIVKDFVPADAFKDAIKGVNAVVHLATDASMSDDPDVVVKNTVDGLKGLINLAKQEPSIKRFTYTSSSRAIAMSEKARETGLEYGPKVWNDYAVEVMYTAKNPMITYSGSKMLAEKAFWEGEVPFVRNAILPDFTMGPAVDDKLRSSTHAWLRGLFNGEELGTYMMQAIPYQWWVNVEDIARLHVGATIFEQVKDKRLLGFTEPYTLNQFLDSMHQADPSKKLIEKQWAEGDNTSADVKDSLEVLKLLGKDSWTGYEETVKANLA